ncbi:hypothetical protein K437DRAFT_153777 [Tilletiaria anomala UBC 951]|uniref:Major facilitator superfamily (MFS) profile domain-containing protein n=1 Tax=Tilletiaria anomala (strain ATCC 24038 / CBS 436.72 / UBC 951) TaxID=1037660 RepID=A0A066VXA6_TILAU|nr:uncharacterized protein K437DRAFT_153777 [Tilletiaria anomala UBC 951]KDN43185.1 hypothetical protein K437DRAFT_153777 [Tilletiaria anomala UBC 951]
MTVSLYIGLLIGIGAVFWGFGCDVIRRLFSWNATLLLSAVFAMAVAGAPTFIGAGALLTCTGLGIRGNLLVDVAMLIELLPSAKRWTLTLLSIVWVLCAMTYGIFPAPLRGTGGGLSMGIQRVFGVTAPLVLASSQAPKTCSLYCSPLFV